MQAPSGEGMVRILGGARRVCDGMTRRELLSFGCLAGALALPRGVTAAMPGGKARSLLFISLFGGPSHQDMWDLKPDAPAEVRGEFKPIETSVPGIRITEHLPMLARTAHRYSLIRSVTHADNGHGSAMYAAFTGWPHRFPNTNPIPDVADSPAYGCVLARLRPPTHTVPSFIAVGGTQFVCGNQIPGQRAGWLGPAYEPFVVTGDPNRAEFRVPELSLLPGITDLRLGRRRNLLQSVESAQRLAERGPGPMGLGVAQARAYELLTSEGVRTALDMKPERPETRDRYGRTTFGQSLILARRLIEAGVPVATVNWSTGGSWDTHSGNFPSLKGDLLPRLDRSLSALLEDLDQRGLLAETLVVVTGEFGRTPQVNPGGGRDHWAGVYTVLMAGGGIAGGRVHGSSDAQAAYPAEDAVGPWDIAATVFDRFGLPPETEIRDSTDRPSRIARGEPIASILA